MSAAWPPLDPPRWRVWLQDLAGAAGWISGWAIIVLILVAGGLWQ